MKDKLNGYESTKLSIPNRAFCKYIIFHHENIIYFSASFKSLRCPIIAGCRINKDNLKRKSSTRADLIEESIKNLSIELTPLNHSAETDESDLSFSNQEGNIDSKEASSVLDSQTKATVLFQILDQLWYF